MRDGVRLSNALVTSGTDVNAAATSIAVPGFDAPIWLRPTRSDYSIFWQSIVQRQYDFGAFPQTTQLLERAEAMQATRKVPVIVDGGGNIGLSLRTFAQDFPFAHVISVEPDSNNFRVLSANAQGLSAPHTQVQAAIASQSGHARVVAQERGSAGLMTEYCAADHPDAIPTRTIDELVTSVSGGVPWIVKLDIEGAQDELFSANTDWIGRADCIILELDDWAFPWSGSSVNFFRALSEHRFDYLVADELIVAFRHVD